MSKAIKQSHNLLCGAVALYFVAASPLQAQESAPRPKADWEKRIDQISEMENKARAIRSDAQRSYKEAENKCNQNFFTSSKCIAKAKVSLLEAENAAKRIEKQALNLEMKAKAETREAKRVSKMEKAKRGESASGKQETQDRIKREKALLDLEKRKPVSALPPNIPIEERGFRP
jgi:hypothetical protein